MRKTVFALCALALATSVGALAPRAAAMPFASPVEVGAASASGVDLVHKVHCDRRCAREWPRRHYWQWDDRSIWDDSWTVLRPNFWGSPEPHLVPADIWACKWHLPSAQYARWHHQQCRAWQ